MIDFNVIFDDATTAVGMQDPPKQALSIRAVSDAITMSFPVVMLNAVANHAVTPCALW
jgi:hypothetical protein